MLKIIGGDFAGYSIRLSSREILLRRGSHRVSVTRADVAGLEVLDDQAYHSGVRMAVKSTVFSKLGLGGLWGGLSTRQKHRIMAGIRLTGGQTILVQTTQSGYKKLLRYVY